jgi:hypothetical protein
MRVHCQSVPHHDMPHRYIHFTTLMRNLPLLATSNLREGDRSPHIHDHPCRVWRSGPSYARGWRSFVRAPSRRLHCPSRSLRQRRQLELGVQSSAEIQSRGMHWEGHHRAIRTLSWKATTPSLRPSLTMPYHDPQLAPTMSRTNLLFQRFKPEK